MIAAKLKAENVVQCMFCDKFVRCCRIRAGDCFHIDKHIAQDFYLTFQDYFDKRIEAAAHKEDKK